MRRIVLVSLGLLALTASPARAYDAATTHAGMTERAALHGQQLHGYLKAVHGLPLGVLEPIRLDLDTLPYLQREELRQHFLYLNPVHGYRPTKTQHNRALSWLTVGSVLEDMPFSRGRNHFLDPRNGRGLQNSGGRWGQALRMRVLDFMDGAGNLGGIFTGTNFGLNGKSALVWARDRYNELSLTQHWAHREKALTAASAAARKHHLAMALLTAGALLHLLQDMAVPAHVRNDFVTTYLARRSNIALDRASAYETLVRKRYGRTGIPKPATRVPSFTRFDDFFRNRRGTGLADDTQRRFFSLGSLPRARKITRAMSVKSVLAAVNRSMKIRTIRVRQLLLGQAGGSGLYYGTKENPYQLAYRVTPGGRLEFALNPRCYVATAKRAVPRAVDYSAGLLGFLFRGRLTAAARGASLRIVHSGPTLGAGQLTVLWTDARGKRTLLTSRPIPPGTRAGAALLDLPASSVPKTSKSLTFAWVGVDSFGEKLVIGGRWSRP